MNIYIIALYFGIIGLLIYTTQKIAMYTLISFGGIDNAN